MDSFDVSAPWVILAPFPLIPAVEDLARCISALRRRDGMGKNAPAIVDAAGPAPEDSVPIVVLNMEDAGLERGGYTWRAGPGRVEIYGDSRRGLCFGIYSFLAGLGFSWPEPGRELLPVQPGAGEGGLYPLKERSVYVRSNPAPECRRRLVIPPNTPGREILALGRWAGRNGVDALIFSLRDKRFRRAKKNPADKITAELEKDWGLLSNGGAGTLAFLCPGAFSFLTGNFSAWRGESGLKTTTSAPPTRRPSSCCGGG